MSLERGFGWHYIAPGKPMQNSFFESFGRQLSENGFQRKRTGGCTLYLGVGLIEPNGPALRVVGKGKRRN